jgi:outer membrane protein assembly factor BamB
MHFTIAVLCSLFSPLGDDDWTGWRGPHGDGTSAGSPPVEWSAEKNVRWKADLPGVGLSSPIVTGTHVFVTTAVPTGKKKTGVVGVHFPEPFDVEEQECVVLAFDRASGRELWRKPVQRAMPHEPTHPTNSYATPTPASDGTRVYCSFGSLGLYALTLGGEIAWTVDLGDLTNHGHGEGSSPLLHDGTLFLLWAHWGDSFLVALDAATGKERWRTPVPTGNNCSTPLVVHVGDEEQLVVAGRQTMAFDPRSGEVLWTSGEPSQTGNTTMASPVALGELVLVPSVDGRDMRALIAVPGGETSDVLWSARSNDNIPSPLAYEQRFYFLKGDSGQLTVLDSASGDVEFGPERLNVNEAWASPVIAGGRLYVVGRDGKVEVLALAPEPKSLAVNELDDEFEASPAVAGNELFLRGRSHLFCVAEPGAK